MDWQTFIAVGIVTATLLIFGLRLVRPRKKGSCGHGCGCGKKTPGFPPVD
jgi:hypothetical protein